MKCLCVIDCIGLGGAQRQLVNIACGLAARGHHVEIFTYRHEADFRPKVEAAGIRVHYHLKVGRFSLGPLRHLRQLLRDGSFDTVLAFLETPVVYAELATVGMPGLRLIVSERNSVYGGHATAGRVLKSQLHRVADAVVANSNAHHDWMAQRFPFLADRLLTIWNGIDLESFHPAPPPPAHHELRLLGIGRIARAKNIPRLAEATARCIAEGIPVEIDWVGRVDQPDEADAARRRVTELDLDAHWRWRGERSDIPQLLHACDALIAPSLWEGLPNVVCEALASGVPVLASNVSDNARLVPDGVHGFTFPAEDVDAMAAAIRRFAALPAAERTTMGVRARAFAERNLGFAACIDAYERLLTSRSSRG